MRRGSVRAAVLGALAAVLTVSSASADASSPTTPPPPPPAPAPLSAALTGTLRVEADPARTRISVDGGPETPAPIEQSLLPGKHALHLVAPGYLPLDVTAEVTAGAVNALRYELAPSPAPPPPPSPSLEASPPVAPQPATAAPSLEKGEKEEAPSFVPAIVAGGAALVAAGFGVAYGVMALSDQSSYNAAPSTALLDSCRDEAMLSDVGFGVAIAAAATSAVLFYRATTKRSAPHVPSATLVPTLSPHAAGGGLTVSF